ncbi:MAG: cupin domain-containing protein [Woeseiaceae bacterium]
MATESDEILTGERCYIKELINSTDHQNASLARCRVSPGVLTQLHDLSVHEWYVIQSGEGEMFVGDAPGYPVAPGDIVSIPARTAQQIRNTGADDLIFECLCMPRFDDAGYRSLED